VPDASAAEASAIAALYPKYEEHKSLALKEGFSRVNPSLFFINHVYCARVGTALKKLRVGVSLLSLFIAIAIISMMMRGGDLRIIIFFFFSDCVFTFSFFSFFFFPPIYLD
jgi:hypothetical protein